MKEVITLIVLIICVTFGGTALANEQSPTDYIKEMMFSILDPILLDVEEHIQKRGEYYADKISALVEETQKGVSLELIHWEEEEIARAEQELENYYNSMVADLQASVENDSAKSKLEITNKTNLEIEKGKAEIEKKLTLTNGQKDDIDSSEESELNNESENETVIEESNVVEPVTTEPVETIEIDEN